MMPLCVPGTVAEPNSIHNMVFFYTIQTRDKHLMYKLDTVKKKKSNRQYTVTNHRPHEDTVTSLFHIY